jgi:adenine/guanine phosphoribosyltransferase-like PRPP-binding protein
MELLLLYVVGWSMDRALPVTIHSDYLTRAINEPDRVIDDLCSVLRDAVFDSFVVTGVSGLIIAGRLSVALGKPFLYVRKEDEIGHSNRRVEGTLGKRWVFVDDFVSSGATLQRAIDEVRKVSSATTLIGVAQYMALPAQKARYTSRQSLRRWIQAGVITRVNANTIPFHIDA